MIWFGELVKCGAVLGDGMSVEQPQPLAIGEPPCGVGTSQGAVDVGDHTGLARSGIARVPRHDARDQGIERVRFIVEEEELAQGIDLSRSSHRPTSFKATRPGQRSVDSVRR